MCLFNFSVFDVKKKKKNLNRSVSLEIIRMIFVLSCTDESLIKRRTNLTL